MDPNACVALIVIRLQLGCYDTAADAASDLLDWLNAGGFAPNLEHQAFLAPYGGEWDDMTATLIGIASVKHPRHTQMSA